MIEIEVTQEDIDRGEPYSNTQCPIALAACRKFKVSAGHVWVGAYLEVTSKEGKVRKYDLPEEALNLIEDFDSGNEVEPARLRLARVRTNAGR